MTATRATRPETAKIVPLYAFGIRSNDCNVYAGKNVIGYVEAKNVPLLRQGNLSVFSPIENWLNAGFSIDLQLAWGLRVSCEQVKAVLERHGFISSGIESVVKRLNQILVYKAYGNSTYRADRLLLALDEVVANARKEEVFPELEYFVQSVQYGYSNI